ncbi:hypothetical protein AgCh_038644 [Apium graveolens]
MGQPKALATVGMTFLQLGGGAFKPAPDFRSIGSAYGYMSQGSALVLDLLSLALASEAVVAEVELEQYASWEFNVRR